MFIYKISRPKPDDNLFCSSIYLEYATTNGKPIEFRIVNYISKDIRSQSFDIDYNTYKSLPSEVKQNLTYLLNISKKQIFLIQQKTGSLIWENRTSSGERFGSNFENAQIDFSGFITADQIAEFSKIDLKESLDSKIKVNRTKTGTIVKI